VHEVAQHVNVGTERLSDTARELVDANQALAAIPARTRDEISGFFSDWTLADPGLTDSGPGGRRTRRSRTRAVS